MATLEGGDRLEAFLEEMADRVSDPGTLKVGFLEGATYPDGTPVALVAAVQNFGAPAQGIPPRAFFSNMIASKSPGWGDKLARILKQNGYRARESLALMGAGIAGQLRQAIVDTNAPPLSPATIQAKGFDKPLVDTGHMLNSVDSEVV
jgi:hypothetical protein